MLEMNKNIYISARDVAENAKLNHEISEELRKFKTNHQLSSSGLTRGSRSNKDSLATWIPVSGTGMTRIFCLTVFMLLPTLTQAETCTATPDCKSLGYTETSCPDGGVKCPWNTSLMYCCKKCEDKPQTGLAGNLYYCNGAIAGIKVPGQSFAIAMNDALSTMNWNSANSYCTGYRFCGTGTMGRLPTKDELLAIYNNITYLQEQLQKNGGQQFRSSYYWSSSSNGSDHRWDVNPVSGDCDYGWVGYDNDYVRPVLAF